MAFFNVGHGHNWTHNTKGFEWPSFHLRGHRLLYQVGRSRIICQYGLPKRIISNNGLNLNNDMVIKVCTQFKIKHHNSVPYRPKMNGEVEMTNKNVKNIIAKAIRHTKTGTKSCLFLYMLIELGFGHRPRQLHIH